MAAGFGPRIVRYALSGRENVLGELPAAEYGVDTPYGERWHVRGGHRLWHAPEHSRTTYVPDNAPPRCEVVGRTVRVTRGVEPETGLEKELVVTLDGDTSRVTVAHRITNRGAEEVTLAPWALTVMAPGGTAFAPSAPFCAHSDPKGLLPARAVALWPYTRLGDPRFRFGERFWFVRHDAREPSPQKLGFFNREGFVGYAVGGLLFLKLYEPVPGEHADLGSNTEIFVEGSMLELETLGPLARLAPGAIVEHTERWLLGEGPGVADEAALEQAVNALRAR